jgi:formiminoglutamase
VAEASNTGALFERAHALKVHYVLDHQLLAEPKRTYSELQAWLESIDWLHLSFCLDVLPAAQAPGVSAPAALGVGIEHLLPLLTLARESGKLKLAELAELSPPFDQDARTAKLAARLVFEFVGAQFIAPTRSIGQFHG